MLVSTLRNGSVSFNPCKVYLFWSSIFVVFAFLWLDFLCLAPFLWGSSWGDWGRMEMVDVEDMLESVMLTKTEAFNLMMWWEESLLSWRVWCQKLSMICIYTDIGSSDWGEHIRIEQRHIASSINLHYL